MTFQFYRYSSVLLLFATVFLFQLAEAQTPASTRAKNYDQAMYFDVLGQNATLPNPLFEWDLSQFNGRSLALGATLINEKTLSFGFRKLAAEKTGTVGQFQSQYFMVKWPESLFPKARIELLNRDGKVTWNKVLEESDFNRWKKTISDNSKGLKKNPLTQFNWGAELNQLKMPLKNLADGFRFCISRNEPEASERLCSQRYVVRQIGDQVQLGRLKEMNVPRIFINGENSELKGQFEIINSMPLRFFAELASGETLEFSSEPTKVVWSDFAKVEGTQFVRIIGFETPPMGKYQILQKNKDSQLIQKIGFQSTIKDDRVFWLTARPIAQPWLHFPGTKGGVFKHPLPLELAPSSSLRLHLHKNTPQGTYRDGVILKGRKQASSNLESQEISVEATGPQNFEWSFQAKKNAEINRSSLLIKDGDQTYKSYFELYKGYANELSARSSMILSDAGLILMGELAYNIWFEDVLGYDHYHLTKQRWGLSTKYFQSFTKFKVGNFGDAELKNINLDLKYRFTPGIWTRDESHGAMLSYQDLEVNLDVTDFKVPMIGVGWFWARSMPQVFDDLFNYLPMFRYPKWVDMEFIYFVNSLDSAKKLDTNFALNFHGQVLWKKNFFGEAGFGIKRYAFVDGANSFQRNIGYQLTTVYGTIGLGFKF